MKYIFSVLVLFAATVLPQPASSEYYMIEQKDSFYYLISDEGLYKFYSHEESGEFFLTASIEQKFPGCNIMLTDEQLLIIYHDSIFCYSNKNPWDLTYLCTFDPGYTIYGFHGFGPYFFIKGGEDYNLYKIENGNVILIEMSLFTDPGQQYVFFTYPYVVIGKTVYKFIEGYDFYPVAEVGISNVNLNITGNTIIGYYYYEPVPYTYRSVLIKYVIEEPLFPKTVFDGWGLNIPQLHIPFGTGKIYVSKNLYYITWAKVITTYHPSVAYLPKINDRVSITDYYIFLFNADTVKYSKWNKGSVFYPLIWTDLTTAVEEPAEKFSFSLDQNYPNPFNPVTTIKYSIPVETSVQVRIYDILGNEIDLLVREEKMPGNYELTWNAGKIPSGIYFYQLQAGSFVETKKMIFIK